ncbi:MAG: hypothetical protein LR015_11125 [Verrucomicrobia bacterium]|nr:hypothetical protein [Verrucomicrobiota bacterium]
MTFSLGWDRRDEESGRRVNVEFSLIRDKATWKIRKLRGEPREELKPEESDWQELFEVLDRHQARGKSEGPPT